MWLYFTIFSSKMSFYGAILRQTFSLKSNWYWWPWSSHIWVPVRLERNKTARLMERVAFAADNGIKTNIYMLPQKHFHFSDYVIKLKQMNCVTTLYLIQFAWIYLLTKSSLKLYIKRKKVVNKERSKNNVVLLHKVFFSSNSNWW